MSYRSCGECTACCEGWLESKKLDMAPGRPCRHCTSQGCAIYPDRPQDPCVNFLCGWMQPNGRLPGRMRPDRAGAIVVLGRTWRLKEVIYVMPVGPAIPEPTLEWLEGYATRENKPLIYLEHQPGADGFGGTTVTTGFGPPEFIAAVEREMRPEDIAAM